MLRDSAHRPTARGAGVAAGLLVIVAGLFHLVISGAAFLRDAVFTAMSGYLYDIGVLAWGWTHLAVGLLAVLAGSLLLTRASTGRAWVTVVVMLSAVCAFVFAPISPLWSLVVLGVDLIALGALALTGTARHLRGTRRPPDWSSLDLRESESTLYPGARPAAQTGLSRTPPA